MFNLSKCISLICNRWMSGAANEAALEERFPAHRFISSRSDQHVTSFSSDEVAS